VREISAKNANPLKIKKCSIVDCNEEAKHREKFLTESKGADEWSYLALCEHHNDRFQSFKGVANSCIVFATTHFKIDNY
jgi:hypothetical protein